jgi:hypothetical protein
MRFISHIRKYAVGVVPRRAVPLAVGGEQEIVPEITARFWQGDITAEELEFAERRFNPEGRTTEVDMVTPTPLLGRLSVYDTDAPREVERYAQIDEQMHGQPVPGRRGDTWGPGTTRKLIEDKLIARAETSNAFALFEAPALAPPWPKYDEFPGDAEDLLGVLVAQGHHLPAVIEYERQNQGRRDVIAILEDAIAVQQSGSDVPAGILQ